VPIHPRLQGGAFSSPAGKEPIIKGQIRFSLNQYGEIKNREIESISCGYKIRWWILGTASEAVAYLSTS
jgi:hypothetical protein